MHFLIVEDEKPAARLLQRKLLNIGYSNTAMVHSVAEGNIWLSQNKSPDLIFMDIQLSDGTAFDLLEKREISSAIIFTTAFDAYTLRAFKENSIDYLLKPIAEEELTNAIQKFVSRHEKRLDLSDIKKLITDHSTPDYKARFTTRVGQFLRVVDTQDIVCFYSLQGGTYVRTRHGDDYLLDYTLEQLLHRVDPKLFFRINRSHVIRLHYIQQVAVHSNSRLKVSLSNYQSADLIVSRERVSEFKVWLG